MDEGIIAMAPAGVIVDRARFHRSDVIVMSSHALTGVARAVLGSIADAVVRTADWPVMVVRTTSSTAIASTIAERVPTQLAAADFPPPRAGEEPPFGVSWHAENSWILSPSKLTNDPSPRSEASAQNMIADK
jgi:hypothetical protein